MEIDTFNKFMVGVQRDNVVFIRPVPPVLSRSDALLLAAYLVSMAEILPGEGTFQDYLKAVENC